MAIPVTKPAMIPVNITPGSKAIPVVQATTLIGIHHPAQCSSRRSTNHCPVPVATPITKPAMKSLTSGIKKRMTDEPNVQLNIVARIHCWACLMRYCRISHWRTPRPIPMVINARFGRRNLPNTQPTVVAMSHWKQSAQSNEEIFCTGINCSYKLPDKIQVIITLLEQEVQACCDYLAVRLT